MRKFFKYASMMAVAVIAAASFASCSDDDTEGTGAIPQPKISDVQVADNAASLTITPPAGATSIFWAVADSKETPKEFTQVEVTSAAPIPVTTAYLKYGKYKIYAFAQTAGGNSKVLSTPEFEIALNDLIGFRIINMTGYSLDVDVTMGADCEKYVIGAFSNGSYNEEYFIESAKTSISPNPDYPMQPYNVFSISTIIPEGLLSKGTVSSSNESEGIIINYGAKDDADSEITPTKYQIAIYAIDKQGQGHVFTSEEFEVPQPAFGEGLPVEITAETTLTSVAATYTVPVGAKKMIRGYALPIEHADVDWNDPAAVEAALATMAVINPPYMCQYEGQRLYEAVPKSMEPAWEMFVYAAAIDENGQMGKLCWEKFTTKTPVLDGTATVEAQFTEATENTLEFDVTLSSGARAVRLMATTKSLKPIDVDWIFVDPALNYEYIEVSYFDLQYTKNGKVLVENLTPETQYRIYAVAVDSKGKVSPVVDLGRQTTKKEVLPVPIDFTKGIGEATLTKVSEVTYYTPGNPNWGTSESWTVDFTYKVEKGANTKNVYLIKMTDALSVQSERQDDGSWKDYKETIEQSALRMCGTDVEMRARTPFTAFGVEQTQPSMQELDPDYGGAAIILVTEDNDGNFKVADYYIAVADHNVTTERPTE